ncbi:MAG: HD-GYP domain-containing protein [Gammaproteobacteria bacterium]|nr:HD-GYP domain-containing protein [Gammaproteobacteria bacterium]
MKKKIAVEELELGMYVSGFDRPQLNSLPSFRGLHINSKAQIDKLKRQCQYVYIDVPDDLPYPSTRHPPAGKWPPAKTADLEQQQGLDFEVLKLNPSLHNATPRYHDTTELEDEIRAVARTYNELVAATKLLMEDARSARHVDTTNVTQVVSCMVDSIIRNPNALMCFGQLQNIADMTVRHSVHTCIFALTFGRHLGMGSTELSTLGIATLLHDVGKAKVPTEILNKPDRLTSEEYDVMQRHVRWGVEILSESKGLSAAVIDGAGYHHERWNGSGYLRGLRKDQIPSYAQIIGIVDCYDSLISQSSYREPISAHTALQDIYDWRDSEFETLLVEHFIRCMGIYPIGTIVELNTGDIGVVVTVNQVRRLKPHITPVLMPDKSPYNSPKTIKLTHQTTADGQPCEIDRVLEPGAYGIKPDNYMPLMLRN